MRPGQRSVRLALILTALVLVPASAYGTPARQVGQVAVPPDGDVSIRNVSADGSLVLIDTYGSQQGHGLWSINTASGAAGNLVTSFRIRASQSPSGTYVAWSAARTARSCRRDIRIIKTDGSVPARQLALPDAYARSHVEAVTVSDAGRVTVRVGRCSQRDWPFEPPPRALLTADPSASNFRVVARSRSGYARWPVSQNGRVLALCAPVKRNGSRWIARVTVFDDAHEPPRVKSARASGNTGPDCVASDAGTATMTLVRDRRMPHKFTTVGVTVGGDGTPRFSLPGGTRDHGVGLELASPDGEWVTTSFSGFTVFEATIIRTTTGRYSRPIRLPLPGVRGLGSTTRGMPGGVFDDRSPVQWSPFAKSLAFPGSGTIAFFDPSRLKVSRPIRVIAGRNPVTPCFLPSGRVLLWGSSRRGGAARLAVTNAARNAGESIDASQLGEIRAVTCEAAGANRVFLVTAAGTMYELPADAIDGSALVPD